MKNQIPTFLELIDCRDEFTFIYNGITYELINGDGDGKGIGCSLYLANNSRGTFVQSFSSREDFLKNAKIEGKNISEIIIDIKV